MKKIFLVLFAIATLGISANAQKTTQYAIIKIAVNPNLKNFDCNTMQEVLLISEPIAIPEYNETVKWNLAYQFIDWIYKNDKTKLDLIVGYTKLSFHRVLSAKTEAEVTKKAKSYGYYSTRSNCAGGSKTIFTFKDIKYKKERLNRDREIFLKDYVENK